MTEAKVNYYGYSGGKKESFSMTGTEWRDKVHYTQEKEVFALAQEVKDFDALCAFEDENETFIRQHKVLSDQYQESRRGALEAQERRFFYTSAMIDGGQA